MSKYIELDANVYQGEYVKYVELTAGDIFIIRLLNGSLIYPPNIFEKLQSCYEKEDILQVDDFEIDLAFEMVYLL